MDDDGKNALPETDKPVPVPSTEHHRIREEKVDDTVEDTFPASDPPSVGGSTGPND